MSRWHKKDPEWMSQLIRFCNENSLDILIKIHPMYKFSSNKDFSKEMVRQIKQNCSGLEYSISYDADLTKILPKASVLITEYSIVAVEAAFNEVPVIIASFFRDKDNEYSLAYKNEGIAIHATNVTELFDCIKKVLYNDDAKKTVNAAIKKFNYEFNYLHDGNATKRICALLTEANLKEIPVKKAL